MTPHCGPEHRWLVEAGGTGGRFDPPFWLDPARLSLLLLSFALFAILGWLGWLTRQAIRVELARPSS